MSIERMQDERDRLQKKINKDWPSKRWFCYAATELSEFFECPICKAIVTDTHEHAEWHLRCLQ